MAAQLDYSYRTPKGVPGGKFDIAFDEVVSRNNENEDGVMKYGMAVATGATAGKTVKVPVSGTTAAQIEGVAIALPNTEQDMEGNVVVKKNRPLSVMKKGNIWGRLAHLATPTYGSTAYVVVDGDYAGCFTHNSAAVSAYKKCESGTENAKEVVADSTESPTATQIKLSAVTPVAEGYMPAVGDYVISEQIHGATVDIKATFGKASDDGIAVIVL